MWFSVSMTNDWQCNTSPTYQKNTYLYNSKELQYDKMISEALNWDDYVARFYDPQIGRWHVVDPVSSEYHSLSPYVYCVNDPISLIDPDGRDWIPSYDGKTLICKRESSTYYFAKSGFRSNN